MVILTENIPLKYPYLSFQKDNSLSFPKEIDLESIKLADPR